MLKQVQNERKGSIMTDYHVHIGQFKNAYYYADRVFSVLKKNGVDEAYFSSTTNCVFCKESADERFSEHERKNAPSASSLYEAIREEVKNALLSAKEIGIKAHALYWVVPDFHLADLGITVKKVMEDIPYDGFKIHPFSQKWNFKDERILELAEEIFEYAEKYKKRILIHTGVSESDEPHQFEKWFSDFPNVKVCLAHCKDSAPIIELFSKYKNLYGDTAFCPKDSFDAICKAGFEDRMFYGTDFPVTHWYEHCGEKKISDDLNSLTESYARTLKSFAQYFPKYV